MAKVKITGHASGSGVFTITAPNSNTDRTITLPDASVTLGTDATKLPLAGGTLTGDLNFGDNVDANFGASDDLKIYHNGTHSIIQDSGSGDLKIWSSKVEIQSPDAGENIAIFNDDGNVELYHNNAKKFETTATGTTVTRGLFTDGIEITDGTTEDCLKISASSSAHNLAKWTATNSNADQQSIMQFYRNGGLRGSISTSNSATAFNTSSDYRLKENVDYTWDATTRLKQLKPARFNWIADETNTLVDGFIAHEVTSVVPEAVCGAKDAVDSDGNIDAQGIDQSKLVPLLVKTIQELEARITALEA
jgi:hypothetical protein